jgi:hypothetical protein
MTTDTLEMLELQYGLDMIETTTGRNGYPQDLKKALIGFDNFEQCKDIADEFGARITTFHKRDGWQLWERTNNETYEPFENSADDYGDDFMTFTKDDEDDFFENEVKELLDNYDDFDSMREFLDMKEEVLNEIKMMDDDEIVVTHCGGYYETIKKVSMSFYHDTHHYVIGIIID